MEWWDRVVILPARRVWLGMASKLGIRKTGLGKLRKQVRSCEYEDVRIMWELLSRSERKKSTTSGRVLAAFHWPPYNLCSSTF